MTLWQTEDQFFSGAKKLRQHFDQQFEDTRLAHKNRFVWDYWHIPNQYTNIRTPAYHYFPAKLYTSLHQALAKWGRENLGCHDISDPWLTYYIDGCEQNWHADTPHGPWAFVYSLTHWQTRKFTGGETQIWKPKNQRTRRGREFDDLVQLIPPKFNRLTVFDPRLPHGVRAVKGVWEPREGRLVIHGWFNNPMPFVEGTLTRASVMPTLKKVMRDVGADREANRGTDGFVAYRLQIAPSGHVVKSKTLANSLNRTDVVAGLNQYLRALKFPKARGSSTLTVPFWFT